MTAVCSSLGVFRSWSAQVCSGKDMAGYHRGRESVIKRIKENIESLSAQVCSGTDMVGYHRGRDSVIKRMRV